MFVNPYETDPGTNISGQTHVVVKPYDISGQTRAFPGAQVVFVNQYETDLAAQRAQTEVVKRM